MVKNAPAWRRLSLTHSTKQLIQACGLVHIRYYSMQTASRVGYHPSLGLGGWFGPRESVDAWAGWPSETPRYRVRRFSLTPQAEGSSAYSLVSNLQE